MKQINDPNLEIISDFVNQIALFQGVDTKVLASALDSDGARFVCYEPSEVICSPFEGKKRAVIFLSGTAEVFSADESRSVLLRTVGRGDVIGVANLFSTEDFVSRVIAAKKCETVELSPELFGRILENDSRAMYNYIAFLSRKIRYLNRKIVCLTAGSAERRLAYFLDSSVSSECLECEQVITVQMNSLCEMLNLGRASLYRAADKLCEEGFISRDGKKIILLDRCGMMKKYK